MRSTTSALLAAGVTAVIMGGGFAYAAIPSSGTGVISGCYNTKSGELRVIDSQAGGTCTKNETAISWNQQGPKGDVGSAGAPGPAGAAGDPGSQGPAGPAGGSARYYTVLKEHMIDFPSPLVQSNVTIPLAPGDIAASCDAGDVAVSGSMNYNVESAFGSFTPEGPLPVLSRSSSAGGIRPLLNSDGVPTGYENSGNTNELMSVSPSLVYPPAGPGTVDPINGPFNYLSRNGYSLSVTCADVTP